YSLSPSTPTCLHFFLMALPPSSSTLFPYTTLFRSLAHEPGGVDLGLGERARLDHDDDVVELAKLLVELTVALDVGLALREEGKRSEEHTSELQSRGHLVCRLLLEKKKIRVYHFLRS